MSTQRRDNSTTTRRCRTLLAGALVGLIAAFTVFQTACATIVTPVDHALLRDPVSVYLIDYHRHSSLMLPRSEMVGGGLREYAYGDWGWFAENLAGMSRAAGVLLLPTQGALGRADHPLPAGAAELRRRHGFEAVYEIRVERDLARSLLERLDHRFQSRLETMICNPTVGLDLVKDDDRYWFANHCNHATVRWLRELGVAAGPVTTVARFHIRIPLTSSGMDQSDASSSQEP